MSITQILKYTLYNVYWQYIHTCTHSYGIYIILDLKYINAQVYKSNQLFIPHKKLQDSILSLESKKL